MRISLRPPVGLGKIGELSDWSGGVYPSSGFLAFEDFALGNGDRFGLYWPIGLEDREPLVAETMHDQGVLVPAFSNLASFLRRTARLDEADHPDWPTFRQDGEAPHACLEASRAALKEQAVDRAVDLLRRAVERLPEYTAALTVLYAQHLRQGAHDEACRAAVRAVRSPPSFGYGAQPEKAWGWLSRQKTGPDDLAEDPIWLRRASLAKPPAGGAKENPVYPVLLEAAVVYEARGEVVEALTLLRAYGEFMDRETVSFQARYGFVREAHRDRQLDLEDRLPHGPRRLD